MPYELHVPFSASLVCPAGPVTPVQFPYTPRSTDYGITQEPRVPVIFANPVTGNFVLLFCLVDSGASDIILNAQFAPLLGIDLTAAPHRSIKGLVMSPFGPSNTRSPYACRQPQKHLRFPVPSCRTCVSTAYLDRTAFSIPTRLCLKNTTSVLPSHRWCRRRNNLM
jgi:hypothetical protein